MRITSADNPTVRRLRRLTETTRAARTSGRTIVEGIHLVDSAVTAGIDIETLVLSDAAGGAARDLAAVVSSVRGIRPVELAARLYDSLAPVEHGAGILAEIPITSPPLPERLVADAVYLDGLQDPGNVGTVLRTAAAAGVRHVAAATGTAFLWAPKVMRAAMGAHFALSLYEDVSAERLAGAFRGERIAADARAPESVYAPGWGGGPTVWLFGSEGRGLSAPADAVAQRRLHIPIDDHVESLNVAAAVAVCLFEQRRRRG